MDGHTAHDGREPPVGPAQVASVARASRRSEPRPSDIAITGMSAIMPGASDLRRYWENILDKVNAIEEVPSERWPVGLYFDPDRDAPDKIQSKWGGFIPDTLFDPMRFGIPPVSVPSIDPAQLLALVAAEAALADAGLMHLAADQRRRASVILGFTGGLGELGVQYAARSELPRAMPSAPAETLDFLPRWTSDSFAGLLPNVVAGRIANRFDFGGANFVVDAACASSLAALRQAVIELESGRSDFVLCGAVETGQGPFAFTCFSKAQALSPSGKARAFDANADGTAISEGIAMLVLRRLEDAQAAGDRIYAVIKGVDGSSDGRALSMMAPLPEGQKRALRRSYEQAGYSPATVGLFEAHGTGTVSGDAAEIESLSGLLVENGASACAVGSVKTLIGHTKGAAGLAGLIKVALGLHHRVLPPHSGVEQPNSALRQPDSPLGLHQRALPWLQRPDAPRRAGVSAFGFGGANYHVTLEEHAEKAVGRSARDRWPVELFVWRTADRTELASTASAALSALQAGAKPDLASLSRALALGRGAGRATLAIVSGSHEALATLLAQAVERLNDRDGKRPLPRGVYFSDAPLSADGQVAMLFPGQGSQYPDMARELAVVFDEVREALEEADAVVAATPSFRDRADPRLSRLVYPFDRFGDDEETAARSAIAATNVAQPALGAIEVGLLELTARLGLKPTIVAGHSYGEYVALHAAGVLSRRDLFRVSEARGRSIINATRDNDLGTMAAVEADAATVRAAIGDGVVVANLNSPNQTVISGARAAVAAAMESLAARSVGSTSIPVSAAFHSPLMQPAEAPLVRFFDEIGWAAPRIPVYANTTAAPHDSDPGRIRSLLGRHLTEPVDFMGMIEAIYASGARVFLEVGPKSVLTTLVERVLGERPHCAVALDGAGGGLTGLLHALAALVVQGVSIDLSRLFEGREIKPLDLADWGREQSAGPPRNCWLVNGTRSRPANAVVQTMAATPANSTSRPALASVATDAGKPIAATPRQTREARVTDMHGYHGPIGLDDNGQDPPASGIDRAMADHHQIMRQFLQVQERAMLAYLNAGERAPRPFSTPKASSSWQPAMRKPAAAAPLPSRAAERPVSAPVAPPPATTRTSAVPTPPPAVERTSTTAHKPAPTIADPKALLLKLAGERTGYPEDMLDLDLDMEADLGIDSIKRVEILGAFRKAQPAAVSDFLKPQMAQIAKSKTLRQVLDKFSAALAEAPEADRPFDQAGEGRSAAALSRYVIRPEAEELPSGRSAAALAGVYLVVPDRGGGVAAALTKVLERDGAQVRLAPESVAADDAEAEAWLASVRAKDRIRGLISLASIAPSPSPIGTAEWRAGMDKSVKSLFALLRLAAADLATDGVVAFASMMGGHFGRDILRAPERRDFFAGAGGGVGLIKSLAVEWPGCRCKAIDLDPNEGPAEHTAHIYAEIVARAGRREVGYPRGARTVFRTIPARLNTNAGAIEKPNRDWVVLAVGGARGITAETCRPFAAAGATCVVVGRSALPEPENRATAELADANALRTFFLREATTAKKRPTPAKIEARIAAVLRDRETRANMADFAALGARVDYRICDVLQEADVEGLLEAVYAQYGRIDAVLFGAGVIEDRLIVDKTRESLSRVFDTKVDGAYFLARHLRPRTLKFVALFSSVAGRYGNRGQSDYGAANEVLNRLAWQLQARLGPSVKVSSVNWGAWARTTNGAGMLTPETARQFRERGLRLIEPDEGRDFLLNELMYASREEVEVVAGEHRWDELEDEAARAPEGVLA